MFCVAADGAWKFGDFRNCDPPSWTAEGMMESLNTKQVDFIFYTGEELPSQVALHPN